ncbi:UNVERIFIED_CONTAM: hypothetical protein FKN15_043874 [Acipenser sinensis]
MVGSKDWDPVEVDLLLEELRDIPVAPEKKRKSNKVSGRDKDPGKGENTQLKESVASKNKKSRAIKQNLVTLEEWLRLTKNSFSQSNPVNIPTTHDCTREASGGEAPVHHVTEIEEELRQLQAFVGYLAGRNRTLGHAPFCTPRPVPIGQRGQPPSANAWLPPRFLTGSVTLRTAAPSAPPPQYPHRSEGRSKTRVHSLFVTYPTAQSGAEGTLGGPVAADVIPIPTLSIRAVYRSSLLRSSASLRLSNASRIADKVVGSIPR